MHETLYDTDHAAWCDAQMEALRIQRWDVLDLAHLIEELEMAKERHVSEMENRLRQLLLHLLKLIVASPSVRRDNERLWTLTCTEQRRQITRRLARTPSLRPLLPRLLADAYDDARLEALQVFRDLDDDAITEVCPWTLDEVRRDGFFPV